MPLAKCPRSGKLFDKAQTPVHPDVLAEEEADYEKVLDFLAENGRRTKSELARLTGVAEECIQRMLDWGRIEELDEAKEAELEEKAREEDMRRAKRESERKAKLRQQLEETLGEGQPGQSDSGNVKERVHDILSRKRGH